MLLSCLNAWRVCLLVLFPFVAPSPLFLFLPPWLCTVRCFQLPALLAGLPQLLPALLTFAGCVTSKTCCPGQQRRASRPTAKLTTAGQPDCSTTTKGMLMGTGCQSHSAPPNGPKSGNSTRTHAHPGQAGSPAMTSDACRSASNRYNQVSQAQLLSYT